MSAGITVNAVVTVVAATVIAAVIFCTTLDI
jgi:hypothetical protein